MKNFHTPVIISTYQDAAEVVGVSRMSLYRLRCIYSDVPALPTLRFILLDWASKRGVPRKRGRQFSTVGDAVSELREENLTFPEIGKRLGISKQAAFAAWKRIPK